MSIAGINQAVEESLAKIAQIKEHSEDLEKIGEAMTELQGKIEQSFKSLEDFSHTDNVKVYRNVQAAVIEELEKQTLELKEEQKKSAKNSKTALIFAIITMILGIADTAILLAMVFQII